METSSRTDSAVGDVPGRVPGGRPPEGSGGDDWAVWAWTLLAALPRPARRPLRILELCARDGRVAWYVAARAGADLGEYLVTTPQPVRERRLGRRVRRARAEPERLHYDDRSFDVVCGLGVLGASRDPASAAVEVTRVARRRVVLLERNGICSRHLAEAARCIVAGGGSRVTREFQPPWLLRGLFPASEFAWLGLRPVPLGRWRALLGRWVAHAPGARWVASANGGVLIVGERKVPAVIHLGSARRPAGVRTDAA